MLSRKFVSIFAPMVALCIPSVALAEPSECFNLSQHLHNAGKKGLAYFRLDNVDINGPKLKVGEVNSKGEAEVIQTIVTSHSKPSAPASANDILKAPVGSNLEFFQEGCKWLRNNGLIYDIVPSGTSKKSLHLVRNKVDLAKKGTTTPTSTNEILINMVDEKIIQVSRFNSYEYSACKGATQHAGTYRLDSIITLDKSKNIQARPMNPFVMVEMMMAGWLSDSLGDSCQEFSVLFKKAVPDAPGTNTGDSGVADGNYTGDSSVTDSSDAASAK